MTNTISHNVTVFPFSCLLPAEKKSPPYTTNKQHKLRNAYNKGQQPFLTPYGHSLKETFK